MEVVFHMRLSSFEACIHCSLISYAYVSNLVKLLLVVIEMQSICTAAGWMGGWVAGWVAGWTAGQVTE